MYWQPNLCDVEELLHLLESPPRKDHMVIDLLRSSKTTGTASLGSQRPSATPGASTHANIIAHREQAAPELISVLRAQYQQCH